MPKQAILFDIDGTLVDSNDAHVAAWCEAFAGEGYHFDRATIHHHIGKGADNFIPSLVPDAPDDVQERLKDAHSTIYKERYIGQVTPFPGARDLLVKSKDAGMKVLLASSASGDELDHYVRLLDAGDIIDGATSKDDVEHSKPCPDIFEAAVTKAEVAPGDALVVGDTPYDIIAARRSGVDTVALLSGKFPEQELRAEEPVAVYEDVADLLADFSESPICR
ncbi:MAG TPA: HAD family hydrolase [Sphingomicrobium sp.]|jgi:membrane protein